MLCSAIPAQAQPYGQPYAQKVVAAVLVGEAGGEGTRGMAAVAEVIRQRGYLLHKTPLQVVQVRHAFSCLNKTSANNLVLRHRAAPCYQPALRLSSLLFSAPDQLPHRTFDATHFTRKEEKPWWARGHKPVVIIGSHAFYRLPKAL